jgi:hypothetical protein
MLHPVVSNYAVVAASETKVAMPYYGHVCRIQNSGMLSRLVAKEIPPLLMKLIAHCRVCNSLPLVSPS